jgi:hypothetical protein
MLDSAFPPSGKVDQVIDVDVDDDDGRSCEERVQVMRTAAVLVTRKKSYFGCVQR